MRDSIHFFKRGVQPVWEDPRNVHGGSWTFRIKNGASEEFWKEVLMLAVGEQFSDAIESGMSFSLSSNYPNPPKLPPSMSPYLLPLYSTKIGI